MQVLQELLDIIDDIEIEENGRKVINIFQNIDDFSPVEELPPVFGTVIKELIFNKFGVFYIRTKTGGIPTYNLVGNLFGIQDTKIYQIKFNNNGWYVEERE